jgi:hypothetical protein
MSMDNADKAIGESEQNKNVTHSSTYQQKLAVHERDRYICICCREQFDDDSHLDVDHIVPEGKGGSNSLRNKVSVCRRCHEAKHDERDHAPTIRWTSTGDMVQKDFIWYRHFWKEVIPAMSEAVGYRVEPLFNIANSKSYQAWHIPQGDLRRLDGVLSDMSDIDYVSMSVHHYI